MYNVINTSIYLQVLRIPKPLIYTNLSRKVTKNIPGKDIAHSKVQKETKNKLKENNCIFLISSTYDDFCNKQLRIKTKIAL